MADKRPIRRVGPTEPRQQPNQNEASRVSAAILPLPRTALNIAADKAALMGDSPSDNIHNRPQQLDLQTKLVDITLDETSLTHWSLDAEHERQVALYDLLSDHYFALPSETGSGPYRLALAIREGRLIFDVADQEGKRLVAHHLALSSFRRFVRDYGVICEHYCEAIRQSSPSQIEAIDMGRRSLHDEAAHMLLERLSGKILLDHATARRFFTVIYTFLRRA